MNQNSMDGDIRKLLALLKRILKNHSQGSEQIAKFMDQKSFDLNLCFFTFVPMSPDDLMDFEDMYEEFLSHSDEASSGDEDLKIEFKLNSEDLHFLKKYGIQF